MPIYKQQPGTLISRPLSRRKLNPLAAQAAIQIFLPLLFCKSRPVLLNMAAKRIAPDTHQDQASDHPNSGVSRPGGFPPQKNIGAASCPRCLYRPVVGVAHAPPPILKWLTMQAIRIKQWVTAVGNLSRPTAWLPIPNFRLAGAVNSYAKHLSTSNVVPSLMM